MSQSEPVSPADSAALDTIPLGRQQFRVDPETGHVLTTFEAPVTMVFQSHDSDSFGVVSLIDSGFVGGLCCLHLRDINGVIATGINTDFAVALNIEAEQARFIQRPAQMTASSCEVESTMRTYERHRNHFGDCVHTGEVVAINPGNLQVFLPVVDYDTGARRVTDYVQLTFVRTIVGAVKVILGEDQSNEVAMLSFDYVGDQEMFVVSEPPS